MTPRLRSLDLPSHWMIPVCLAAAFTVAAGCNDKSSGSARPPVSLVSSDGPWTLNSALSIDSILDETLTPCTDTIGFNLDPGQVIAAAFTATAGHEVELTATTVGFAPLAVGIYGPKTASGWPTTPLASMAQDESDFGDPAVLTYGVQSTGTYALVVGLGPAELPLPIEVALTTDGYPNCVGNPCLDLTEACNDDDACTDDACEPGVGCVFSAIDCDDGESCTFDGCESEALGCVNLPDDCSDGDACTDDSCTEDSGCVHTATSCDDGDACTDDDCDEKDGCFTTAVDCNDDSLCTLDACDPAEGCVLTPVVCNDGNACTTDDCDDLLGCTVQPIVCNDSNACTVDGCDPASGCTTTPSPCDDNDPLTVDTCTPGAGCGSVLVTSEGVACELVGGAGSEFLCAIQLVHASPKVPLATSLGFALLWDPAKIEVTDVVDFAADTDGAPGEIVSTPPNALEFGHTVEWLVDPLAGRLEASIKHPVGPTPIGTATFVGTELSGAPEVVWLRGSFLTEGYPSDPHPILVESSVAGSATGAPLITSVLGGWIVVDGATPPSGIDCDDGNACTEGSPGGSGCGLVPVDCTDGGENWATCIPDVGCVPFDPTVLPSVNCLVSGAPGDRVYCPLRVALAQSNTPPPSVLQVDVRWNAEQVSVVGAGEWADSGDPDAPTFVTSPPAPLASGHQVSTYPAWPQAFHGVAEVGVAPAGAGDPGLTNAVFDGSSVTGDPNVLWVEVVIEAELGGGTTFVQFYPLLAQAGDVTLSTTPTVDVAGDEVLVVDVANCNDVEDYCLSDDLCVTPACAPGGNCYSTPADCDDGLAHTVDFCDPAVGCGHAVVGQPICDVDVPVGESVFCPVRVARATGPTPLPAELSFDLAWDPAVIAVTGLGLFESAAPGEELPVFIATPPAALSAGHLVSTSDPWEEASSSGYNSVGIAWPADGTEASALSFAYLDSAAVIGDADVIWIQATRLAVGTPELSRIHVTNTTGADTTGADMSGALYDDIVVLWASACSGLEDCAAIPNASCTVTGSAGQPFECTVELAHLNALTPWATAASFGVQWPAGTLNVLEVGQYIADPEGGEAFSNGVLSSGHVVTSTVELPQNFGALGFSLAHPLDASTPLSDAYLAPDGLVGEPELLLIRGEILVDSGVEAPHLITVSNPTATAGETPLNGVVEDGRIVVGLADCSVVEGYCAQSNPCLPGVCGADGLCVTEPVTCDSLPEGPPLACIPNTDGECQELLGTPWCQIPPGAGETTCAFELVLESETTPGPAAMQFNLNFDPTEIELLGFESLYSPDPDAPPLLLASPPAPLSSGHALSSVPTTVGGASQTGSISVIAINTSNPYATLTEAYWSEGGVVGEPVLFQLRVRRAPFANFEPASIYVDQALGAKVDSSALTVEVVDGTLTFSALSEDSE